MRKLFWTFPHLFFHHYILSDEDKDRLLLSIGLVRFFFLFAEAYLIR